MAVRPGFWAFPKGQPQGAVPTIGEADFETSKSVIPDRAGYKVGNNDRYSLQTSRHKIIFEIITFRLLRKFCTSSSAVQTMFA